jgi:hypothetical protein
MKMTVDQVAGFRRAFCQIWYVADICVSSLIAWSTAIPTIIEGRFQDLPRFSSSKLVLVTVESCFLALNYYGNGSSSAVFWPYVSVSISTRRATGPIHAQFRFLPKFKLLRSKTFYKCPLIPVKVSSYHIDDQSPGASCGQTLSNNFCVIATVTVHKTSFGHVCQCYKFSLSVSMSVSARGHCQWPDSCQWLVGLSCHGQKYSMSH